MHRIDTPSATVTQQFTEGSPSSGLPATTVSAAWLNDVQEELISILAAAGIDPLKGEQGQVLQAINELIAAHSAETLSTARIDVDSADTISLTEVAPNTRHINITGTTTINGFTVEAGRCYFVRFAGVLTLTNNGSIVTQTGANITTATGDTCIIRATADNVVEVLCYVPGTRQPIGYGQAWQDVTASRAFGVTYTNTSGRPIMISLYPAALASKTYTLSVNGQQIASVSYGSATVQLPLVAIVPHGATYAASTDSGTLEKWMELR